MIVVKIKDVDGLVKNLREFLDVDYVKGTDEYLVTKQTKFLLFNLNTYVIQILKDNEDGRHYAYLDDLKALDSIDELKRILDVIIKQKVKK